MRDHSYPHFLEEREIKSLILWYSNENQPRYWDSNFSVPDFLIPSIKLDITTQEWKDSSTKRNIRIYIGFSLRFGFF